MRISGIVSIGAFLLISSGIASAASFTLYSTGFSSSGTELLPTSHDGNWTIVSNPGGTSSVPFVTFGYSPIPLLESGPFKNGWLADSFTSQWISPKSVETSSDSSGAYIYEESFTLDPGEPVDTAIITGRWAMDNTGYIMVNGQAVTTGIDGLVAVGTTGAFKLFTSFVLDSSNANFVSGVNTIDFVVQNNTSGSPNVTGVNINIQDTFVAPEPGTFVLMALGVSVLCAGAFRRKMRHVRG